MRVKTKLLKRGSQIPFKVFNSGGREHYNVKIYLYADPEELTNIRQVEYLLHPSFRNRRRVSSDRDTYFAIELWTWGMFDIDVTVHFENGDTEEMRYTLDYPLPADDGTNYVQL